MSRFLEPSGQPGITHCGTADHHLGGNTYVERFHRCPNQEEGGRAECRDLEGARESNGRYLQECKHNRLPRGTAESHSLGGLRAS